MRAYAVILVTKERGCRSSETGMRRRRMSVLGYGVRRDSVADLVVE